MKSNIPVAVYLFVCAAVTYFVRMTPMVILKKKIKNRFVLSFLHYIPYAVLSVMTIPAVFYAVPSKIAAIVGFGAAMIASYFEKSLAAVAAFACAAVLAAQLLINLG